MSEETTSTDNTGTEATEGQEQTAVGAVENQQAADGSETTGNTEGT